MNALLTPLLAKSGGDPPAVVATLAGHLAATAGRGEALCDATLGEQLAAFGLEPDPWAARARRILTAAALWHDLGKANDHFQGMLAGCRRNIPQGLRHETVGLLLALRDEPLGRWLRHAFETEEEWHLFLWALAGHHRKDWRNAPPEGSGTRIRVLSAHADFARCLCQIAGALSLPSPPSINADLTISLLSSGAPAELGRYFRRAAAFHRGLTPDWRKFAALVKASLIAADVAASSMARAGDAAPDPVPSLNRVATPGDFEAIVTDRLKGAEPREFQLQVAAAPGRIVLVEAGCGTGKTIAAYLRAARHPLFAGRRLFVCYPTTGTATEGFGDYLCSLGAETREPRPGAALFHSRAAIDYRLILDQPDADDGEALARADALSLWDTPITVCTVDTVLGLLQNQRTGHYLWPAIARGAFVFDEIHSYDDPLFAALLRFLRDLPGLPALLMTASLPKPRLEAIEHILRRRGETLTTIPGPREIEELHRYVLARTEPARAGRTLHVSNTVARCIAAAGALQARGIIPFVYHSRFKYRDRVERHRSLVEAFRSGRNAHACTTQVCEVSLDLSARLLISDLAPIPALIQRLGRLNRHNPDPGQPLPFHIIEPDSSRPYSPPELDLARRWLAALGTGPLSQRDLAAAWEKLPAADLDLSNYSCSWLDGGPLTIPASLRGASHTITVLMEEDRREVETRPGVLPEFLLPMPNPPDRLAFPGWPRHKHIPVAPAGSILYDQLLGARWAA